MSAIELWLHNLLSQNVVTHLAILLPLGLQLLGLALAVSVDPYISKEYRRILGVIIGLLVILVAQNDLEYCLAEAKPGARVIYCRTVVAVIGYWIRPVILLLFLYIINSKRRHIRSWILVGINAAVSATALFGSEICFHIGEQNHYVGGPLSQTCLIVSVLFLLNLLALTLRKYIMVKRREILILVFITLMIILASILDSNVGAKDQVVEYVTIASVSGSVLYYIWLHLQFVREHEKELRDGQRVQMMLSQIKPHFLYNSLGAIEELFDSDPKLAKEATKTFAKYLRGNMNSISATTAIPFESELSHTRFYLELEQIRFEDALQVEYDIACTEFRIPALTVEPLVENAVRHGVRENEDGRGTVTIRTWEEEDCYLVSVTDDGPGFDVNQALNEVLNEGHVHIGLSNVKERLTQICGGTLTIRSARGEGTTATIRLPKERGEVHVHE